MFISEFGVWVLAAQERYKAARKLLDASKSDPPNEPYRSKYEARDILAQLTIEIETKWKTYGTFQVKLLSMLFKYEMGIIGIETEEYRTGCDILTAVLEEIRDIAEKPECVHLALSILNQLGILWSDRGDDQKALDYLSEAETMYANYKANSVTCPFAFEDLFLMENITKHNWAPFEKTFTLSLYYLAQVYEHMNENTKSAKYCRETLKRQRESGEFETNDWAVNCATLSQYFIQEKIFQEARHLLCSAAFTLLKYEMKIEKKIEENREAWNEVHQSKATISCCWIKYSINLLSDMQAQLKEGEEVEKYDRLIDDLDVLVMENKISSRIHNYDDAKLLFLFAQNHVSVAKSYYTLNNYANNHAQIIQDHSKLYKSLAAWDPDLRRKCKMHKRRVDMLEEIQAKLNPQFYLSVCRQIQFELGDVCNEMIDLKTKIANSSNEGMTMQGAKKVNSLILNGIKHFKDFIDSLKDKDRELPAVFSDDIVRPALIAHFYIGTYHSKLIETDTNKKLHNLTVTEEYYKFIVDYIEKNPVHGPSVEVELPVVKEMLELMPQKVSQITGTILF